MSFWVTYYGTQLLFSSRPLRTVLAVFVASLVFAVLASILCSHLVWNRTASLPLGLYWLAHDHSTPRPGDVIAFPIPPSVRHLVHERHYLHDGDELLKTVVAVAGDDVCIRGERAFVNEQLLGPVLFADMDGRPLPHDTHCGPVSPGHVYVASHHPRSFDSRTFGPVDIATVRGKATPLWTY